MAELWLTILFIVCAAAWYFYGKSTFRQRQSVTIYFWTFVLAIGAAGFVFQWITTGHLPAPCCT